MTALDMVLDSLRLADQQVCPGVQRNGAAKLWVNDVAGVRG